MRNKLFFKIVAIFGIVMLVFSAILGGVFVMLFREHTLEINKDNMVNETVSIADTISSFQNSGTESASGNANGNGNGNAYGNGYGAYLRSLDPLTTMEVWIVNENLEVSVCGDKRLSGHGADLGKEDTPETINSDSLPNDAKDVVQEVFEGKVTYGKEFSGSLGVNALTVGAPIYNGDEVVGAVLAHSAVSGINEAVNEGLITVIIGCLVALIISGIVAIIIAYIITKPIFKINNTALTLAEGNYDVTTGVKSKDEIGQLATSMDILAAKLKVAEEEVSQLDQMRSGFVTNISHELRTPVAVLRGSIELLEDGTISDPAEVSEYYEQMLKETKHMERLINDLLELFRLQDIGFKLQKEDVNLCNIVSDSVRAIKRIAAAKSISIESTLPEDECIVYGDYDRLRQLIIILLDNAVKFSYDEGKIDVKLSKEESENSESSEEVQGKYRIEVTDYGRGIDKDDLAHIFDCFHKSASKENEKGSGLGLAIATEIVSRHDATICGESDETHTTFTVVF